MSHSSPSCLPPLRQLWPPAVRCAAQLRAGAAGLYLPSGYTLGSTKRVLQSCPPEAGAPVYAPPPEALTLLPRVYPRIFIAKVPSRPQESKLSMCYPRGLQSRDPKSHSLETLLPPQSICALGSAGFLPLTVSS